MKKLIVLAIVFWVICGIHNWGAILGYSGTKYPPARRHYGIAFLIAIVGPFGVPAAIGCTNLYEHGFLWR